MLYPTLYRSGRPPSALFFTRLYFLRLCIHRTSTLYSVLCTECSFDEYTTLLYTEISTNIEKDIYIYIYI
jgi:hypothetical protein